MSIDLTRALPYFSPAQAAEETAPLRQELAAATSWSERTRVRLRIWRASARLRRTLGTHGSVRW